MTKFSAAQQNQLAQIGAFLRDNREKQSKSLADIAVHTYIRPQLLNGIETGDPTVLPEPIFVQGFIRRYGEVLGLNGIELSQQFTVDSIPSTPRPARQAPPGDTATTRFTRANSSAQSGTPAANTSRAATPMFSSGVVANTVSSYAPNTTAKATANTAEDLTLGRPAPSPFATAAASFDPVQGADALLESTLDSSTELDSELDSTVDNAADRQTVPQTVRQTEMLEIERASATTDDAFDQAVDSIAATAPTPAPTTDELPTIDEAIPFSAESGQNLDINTAEETTAETRIEATDAEADFASKVAAFDRENLNQTHPNEPALSLSDLGQSAEQAPAGFALDSANETATGEKSDLGTQGNAAFDDNLPAAFTTEANGFIAQGQSPTKASVEPVGVEPVGVDYGRSNQPNLKPFIIGGVMAAIATVALVISSVIGGGNRQPSVANSSETPEQVAGAEAGTELPPVPDVAPAEEPPISTAPVYVEATATSEAWVSIIADGNPTPIFEGTLQPGESQVWEAAENLSVYSGDAGALRLAANGGEAEVMGAPGQPEEKIFPQ